MFVHRVLIVSFCMSRASLQVLIEFLHCIDKCAAVQLCMRLCVLDALRTIPVSSTLQDELGAALSQALGH
jgi:hypothetical protein